MDTYTPAQAKVFERAVREYVRQYGYSIDTVIGMLTHGVDNHDVETEAFRRLRETQKADPNRRAKPAWQLAHETVQADEDPQHDMIATNTED
jgi:hypothetical protein